MDEIEKNLIEEFNDLVFVVYFEILAQIFMCKFLPFVRAT